MINQADTYNGNEPFIFVSYSHKDSGKVIPIVRDLQSRGYRVWYDNGIEVGSEFTNYIAERLEDSSCMLAFVSKNAAESDFCRREISFAVDEKKPIISVYLDNAKLPAGMRLQLKSLQAMYLSKYPSTGEFVDALSRAELLEPCLSGEKRVHTGGGHTGGSKPPVNRWKWLSIAAIGLMALVTLVLLIRGCEGDDPAETTGETLPPETSVSVMTDPEETTLPPESTEAAEPTDSTKATENAPEDDMRWMRNVLRSDDPKALDSELTDDSVVNGECPSFGSRVERKSVRSITILNSTAQAPADALDLSEWEDGSVLGWFETAGSGYDLYLAGDGGILAPEDCTRMFAGYVNLTQVTGMEYFHTDQVKSMRCMFSECVHLWQLDVSRWNTGKVEDMQIMFSGCESLRSLAVENWDTSNVVIMSNMFRECTQLEELDVSRWNTDKVRYMQVMFQNCVNLKELDVSNWNTSRVTKMSFMFANCKKLENLDLSGWNLDAVTEYQGFLLPGTLINGEPWENLFNQ